jgi:hypothetical protein
MALCALNFARMAARWLLTVLTLIFSASAICFEGWPAAMSLMISRSRDVSDLDPNWGAAWLETVWSRAGQGEVVFTPDRLPALSRTQRAFVVRTRHCCRKATEQQKLKR